MGETSGIVHHGYNVRRLRELLSVKQEAIAAELKISQQAMSKLEKKEKIENETLEKISKVLGIPAGVIRSFNEESFVNIIANTFNDSSSSVVYKPALNPIEKITELYERIIREKDAQIALLGKKLYDYNNLGTKNK